MKASGEKHGLGEQRPGEGGRVIPTLREIIEERKEKAIESLSVSFAQNRLPLEEYERLAEYIHKTESERELQIVEKIVAEYDRGNSAETDTRAYKREPDDSPYSRTGINLTFLSARVISGPVEDGFRFVSVLGSQQIKIRKADLDRQRTEIEVITFMGDSFIRVEPGIRVVNKSIPVLGNSDTAPALSRQARDEGPELCITGVALLGNITIKPLKE